MAEALSRLVQELEGLRCYDPSCFKDVVLSVTGFYGVHRQLLRQLASICTLRYEASLIKDCTTHLVCHSPAAAQRSEKLVKAQQWGIPVVSLQWLLDSIGEGAPLPVDSYQVELPAVSDEAPPQLQPGPRLFPPHHRPSSVASNPLRAAQGASAAGHQAARQALNPVDNVVAQLQAVSISPKPQGAARGAAPEGAGRAQSGDGSPEHSLSFQLAGRSPSSSPAVVSSRLARQVPGTFSSNVEPAARASATPQDSPMLAFQYEQPSRMGSRADRATFRAGTACSTPSQPAALDYSMGAASAASSHLSPWSQGDEEMGSPARSPARIMRLGMGQNPQAASGAEHPPPDGRFFYQQVQHAAAVVDCLDEDDENPALQLHLMAAPVSDSLQHWPQQHEAWAMPLVRAESPVCEQSPEAAGPAPAEQQGGSHQLTPVPSPAGWESPGRDQQRHHGSSSIAAHADFTSPSSQPSESWTSPQPSVMLQPAQPGLGDSPAGAGSSPSSASLYLPPANLCHITSRRPHTHHREQQQQAPTAARACGGLSKQKGIQDWTDDDTDSEGFPTPPDPRMRRMAAEYAGPVIIARPPPSAPPVLLKGAAVGLKILARPPRGHCVREHHGLTTLKGIQFAEQVQVQAAGLILSTKDKKTAVKLRAPPADLDAQDRDGNSQNSGSLTAGEVLGEVQTFYRLEDGTWYLEYCTLYTAQQAEQLTKAHGTQFALPVGFDRTNELLRSTTREFAVLDHVAGAVTVRRVKQGGTMLKLKGGGPGAAPSYFWRTALDPIAMKCVTDRPATDYIATE